MQTVETNYTSGKSKLTCLSNSKGIFNHLARDMISIAYDEVEGKNLRTITSEFNAFPVFFEREKIDF